jgi:GDPmannose 4,6-dehydratase
MIEKGILDPVIKVGNLDSLRTFADVRDAVRAYYMLVTINPVAGACYNIGGNYVCKVGDMLNALIGISSYSGKISIEIDSERLRPIDADLQVPDTTKFKKHTGWEPQITFEQTICDLLNYWRERVNVSGAFLQR